ncbi:MAG: helix-turn-helix transcriptional regulator [Candidatus Gastranaerophilales bacterium]
MQHSDEKTKLFAKILGETIKDFRLLNKKYSINQLANEYELDVGNVSRIENGKTDAKMVTLWKIAEALEINLSELIKILEEKLGENFHFFDE